MTHFDELIINKKTEFKYEKPSSTGELGRLSAAATSPSNNLLNQTTTTNASLSTTNRTSDNLVQAAASTHTLTGNNVTTTRDNVKEKLKKLTMAIFVDSFDDYSIVNGDSSSSSSSSSSSTSPFHNNNHHHHISLPNSLREFEANEARANTGSMRVRDDDEDDSLPPPPPPPPPPPMNDDTPFLFTSNPNNYSNLVDSNATIVSRTNVVARKPPAPPGYQPMQINLINGVAQRAPSSNNLLSPCTEYSNETFETCNQSPTKNQHFVYDSGNLSIQDSSELCDLMDLIVVFFCCV